MIFIIADHTLYKYFMQTTHWYYGDSFLMDCADFATWYTLIRPLGDRAVYRSREGTGPEWAVWQWARDHQQGLHQPQDRVWIALSEPGRPFSIYGGANAGQDWSQAQTAQDRAWRDYFREIHPSQTHTNNLRQQALCLWLDRALAQSPAETVVTQSFPAYPRLSDFYQTTSSDLATNWQWHWFQNASNMWPTLSYWSVTDPLFRGMGDKDTSRPAHLSLEQHRLVSELIREAQHRGDRDLILRRPPQGRIPMLDFWQTQF